MEKGPTNRSSGIARECVSTSSGDLLAKYWCFLCLMRAISDTTIKRKTSIMYTLQNRAKGGVIREAS